MEAILDANNHHSHNAPQQETLILINETEQWSTVTTRIEDIASGKATLAETVLIIDSFAKESGLTKGVNTFVLGLYLAQLDINEQTLYQTEIFPKIAKLILKTPELFPDKVPMLVKGVPMSVRLSKEQCACLLAHMFMCVTVYQDIDINVPINFSVIFSNHDPEMNRVLIEKLKCVFNYFKRVFSEPFSSQYIEFTRIVRDESIHGNCTIEGWSACEDVLSEVEVRGSGKIEDADGAIKIDFANMYLGGGVLGTGRVQEEIMFTVSPEHLVGMLFCECMNDKEAICIRGAERYCAYKGYADSFEFVSDYKDKHQITDDNVVDEEVIAIDAICFGGYEHHQFSNQAIERELNKAYVGFYGVKGPRDRKVNKAISTGKWGCGAFLGDTQLKFVIQWISASRAQRKMIFYSFGDVINMYGYEKILENYKGKKVKDLVKDLFIVSRLKVQVESLKVKGMLGNLDKRLKARKDNKSLEEEEGGVSKIYNKTENVRLFEGLVDLMK